MRDKWKRAVDNSKAFGALLTDLSKAFDCISHDLLVAKLHAYGLSVPALKMIQDCLLNRKQRTKIGSSYRTLYNIISGVPQGSILRPLLFNIFFCDPFLEHKDFCFTNYADGATPYKVANNKAEVIENLTIFTQKLFAWFANNLMKVKPRQMPSTVKHTRGSKHPNCLYDNKMMQVKKTFANCSW